MKKINEDTKNLLKESKSIKQMMDSEGWKNAKGRILRKLSDLDKISGLPKEADMTMVLGRAYAIRIIQDWLNELEGIVQVGDAFIKKEASKPESVFRTRDKGRKR